MKHFHEILTTLGATKIETLDEDTTWDMCKAQYRTPVSNVDGFYLYLKHKCRKKDATPENLGRWRSRSQGKGYELVLTPRSPLTINPSGTKESFGASQVRTTQRMLWDNFLADFKRRPIEVDEYFIDPILETTNNESAKHGARRYMLDWLKGKKKSTAPIAVLIANGGVGKTTLSRILCNELHQQDLTAIPILIEAAQWQHLLQTSFSMDAVWDNAIERCFENASRLRGNEAARRVLIREGLFVVMFDGFDELCINPGGEVSPKDIINDLIELVTPEDGVIQARILLTARETFWAPLDDDIDIPELDVLRLKGFNNEKRIQYFKGRLKDAAERDLALRLSKQIGGGIYDDVGSEDRNEDRLSGAPFILDLIAHHVHRNPDVNLNPYKSDPLSGFLEDVCRRENKRQTLEIAPEKQLELFEELFRDFPDDNMSRDDLQEYLKEYCSVTDPSVVTRFTNHVFLAPNKGLYGSRYEVLRVYFLAKFLADRLIDTTSRSSRGEIANLLAKSSTGKTQVLDWLLWKLPKFGDPKLFAAMHHALKIIRDKENQVVRRESGMALFHLSQKLVPKGSKLERTNNLARILNGNIAEDGIVFRDLTLTGRLQSYDLGTAKFERCQFVDIEFKNCRFSGNSAFLGCRFEGTLEFTACDNAGAISVTDETCSYKAEYALGAIRNRGSRKEIRQSFAEEVLGRALKKFKGDYGFRSIQFRHRTTGFKPGNPYNEKVWDALISESVIEKHPISNVNEGGLHIVDEKNLRREIASFLESSIMGRHLRAVIKSLIK